MSPDLEQFAQRAIKAGRYLEEAQAEGARLGFTTIDDLFRDMNSVITAAKRRSA